jgi:hypothetical protein
MDKRKTACARSAHRRASKRDSFCRRVGRRNVVRVRQGPRERPDSFVDFVPMPAPSKASLESSCEIVSVMRWSLPVLPSVRRPGTGGRKETLA